MNNLTEIKTLLVAEMKRILEIRIADSQQEIALAEESREVDTKSSAGDKYETGRAMMDIEIQKGELQIFVSLKLLRELNNLNLTKVFTKAEWGSLVVTDKGNFFFSIPLGLIKIKEIEYYSITMASPLGISMQNSKAGQTISFQSRNYRIEEIG